jgi:hypothetical protein
MLRREAQRHIRSLYQLPLVGCIGVNLGTFLLTDHHTVISASRSIKINKLSYSGLEVNNLLINAVYALFCASLKHFQVISVDEWKALQNLGYRNIFHIFYHSQDNHCTVRNSSSNIIRWSTVSSGLK